MNELLALTARRLVLIPVSLLALVTLTFVIVSLVPGDPATLIVGEYSDPAQIAEVRERLGLDKPIPVQFADYVGSLVQGDLGRSYYTDQPVADEIVRRLPNTLILVVPALLLAVVLGAIVGGIAGFFRRRWPDRAASSVITVTQGIPEFFLAVVLIYLLVFQAGLLPSPVGMVSVDAARPPETTGILPLDAVLNGSWSTIGSIAAHAILPIVSAGIFLSAYFAKTIRTCVGETMSSPQIEFARACGLPERKVVRYAFLAARTPVLTYSAIMFGVLLSSISILEVVFAWPGVGSWALEGIVKGDIPIIQAFVFVTGFIVILAYLALDIAVAWLDPRISYGERGSD